MTKAHTSNAMKLAVCPYPLLYDHGQIIQKKGNEEQQKMNKSKAITRLRFNVTQTTRKQDTQTDTLLLRHRRSATPGPPLLSPLNRYYSTPCRYLGDCQD